MKRESVHDTYVLYVQRRKKNIYYNYHKGKREVTVRERLVGMYAYATVSKILMSVT